MSRRTTIFSLMLVMAMAFIALAGCGSSSEESTSAAKEGSQATASAETPATTPAVARGSKGSSVSDFSLQRLDGSTLQLSSLRGKAVIIDFWDTWCPPCIKAMPHLQDLSVEYPEDLVVVGVALGREGKGKVQAFVDKNGLTFEVVMFNNDPQLIADFGGFQSIPTTFLIDSDGIVREKWVGGYSKADYEKALKQVLGT